MSDCNIVKIEINGVYRQVESLATELRIPFDGIVYACILAYIKKEIIPCGELIDGVVDGTMRIVRLSAFSYRKLLEFSSNIGTDCQGGLNRLLRYALRNPSGIRAYYMEGMVDPSAPRKISKSK